MYHQRKRKIQFYAKSLVISAHKVGHNYSCLFATFVLLSTPSLTCFLCVFFLFSCYAIISHYIFTNMKYELGAAQILMFRLWASVLNWRMMCPMILNGHLQRSLQIHKYTKMHTHTHVIRAICIWPGAFIAVTCACTYTCRIYRKM